MSQALPADAAKAVEAYKRGLHGERLQGQPSELANLAHAAGAAKLRLRVGLGGLAVGAGLRARPVALPDRRLGEVPALLAASASQLGATLGHRRIAELPQALPQALQQTLGGGSALPSGLLLAALGVPLALFLDSHQKHKALKAKLGGDETFAQALSQEPDLRRVMRALGPRLNLSGP